MNINIIKLSILCVYLFLSVTSYAKAETLLCQKMNGVMINEQNSFVEVPSDSESVIWFDDDKAIVTTDEERIEYRVLYNTQNVVHFANITPIVLEIFSFYPKTNKLFYSKHSQMGYNSQYQTVCIKINEER